MVQKLNKYLGNIGIGLNFQPTGSSGLNVSHSGGVVAGVGAILETAAGNIAVPASTAWTVYVNLVTGVLTSVATPSLPSTGILILWDGTSSSTDVTLIRDVRSWTSTGNAITTAATFNSLLGQFNMVFEYGFGTGAGLDIPNTGSAGSAHDLEPGGTDPVRGIVTGDVSGGIGCQVGIVANNEAFDHPGTMNSDFVDWDNLSATGSFIIIVRTSFARAFDNIIWDAATLPSGFFNIRVLHVGDPDAQFRVRFERGQSIDDSLVTSGSTIVNDGVWHVIVITQPGTGGGLEMYFDGVDVGSPGGGEPDLWFPDVAQSWERFNVGSFGGVTSPWKGDIDYLGVTNTVLTVGQALDLTNAYNGT